MQHLSLKRRALLVAGLFARRPKEPSRSGANRKWRTRSLKVKQQKELIGQED